jgi:V8-like Glu-specific endopeptidase
MGFALTQFMMMKWPCNSILRSLSVYLLVSCVALGANAKVSQVGKTYAVFVTTVNRQTKAATGGVAGTAFFISPTKAFTAFHVLQEGSFKAPSADELRQVWLIHEGEPAIEMSRANVSFSPDQDMTRIEISGEKAVKQDYVFQVQPKNGSDPEIDVKNGEVVTEGFRANTAGPVLVWEKSRLKVEAVPHMERVFSSGKTLRDTFVNLKAADVELKNKRCLQLSYQPIVGMSGGPVLASTGRVIALNSFADPASRQQTWAVVIQ